MRRAVCWLVGVLLSVGSCFALVVASFWFHRPSAASPPPARRTASAQTQQATATWAERPANMDFAQSNIAPPAPPDLPALTPPGPAADVQPLEKIGEPKTVPALSLPPTPPIEFKSKPDVVGVRARSESPLPLPAPTLAQPRVEQAPKRVTCPWNIRVSVESGRSHLEVRGPGGELRLGAVGNAIQVGAPDGAIEVSGEVRFDGFGLSGTAERLRLAWQTDELLLEGNVTVRCPRATMAGERLRLTVGFAEPEKPRPAMPYADAADEPPLADPLPPPRSAGTTTPDRRPTVGESDHETDAHRARVRRPDPR